MVVSKFYKSIALWTVALSVAMGAGIGTSYADEDEKKKSKRQTRSEKITNKILDKYQETGKTRSCLQPRQIRSTTVMSDTMIFFRMAGKKHYLSTLPRKCPGLFREDRFTYSLPTSQLCSVDIITVLDSFGRSWSSCGLGKFKEMVEKPKDEPKEDTSEPEMSKE